MNSMEHEIHIMMTWIPSSHFYNIWPSGPRHSWLDKERNHLTQARTTSYFLLKILNLNKEITVLWQILTWELVHVHHLLVMPAKQQNLIYRQENETGRREPRGEIVKEPLWIFWTRHQSYFEVHGGPRCGWQLTSLYRARTRLSVLIQQYPLVCDSSSFKLLAPMPYSFLNVFHIPRLLIWVPLVVKSDF